MIRYFVFVGSVLVALLFAIDRYLPMPPETGHASDPDKTIIRIRSARSLPEKIVFDTRPRTAAPVLANVDPVLEAVEYTSGDVLAAMTAAPTPAAGTKKEAPVRKRAENRLRKKPAAKPSTITPDRGLASERHDFFAGSWW